MRQFADDPPVEARVAAALRSADHTVAVAETCTGGAVASLLTDVPGSSAYFDRAYVPYSYDSLRQTLGIARETLDEHGVVSGPVTSQLARRARDLAGTTWGIATTGIAGPGGGSADRPVGTAFVGVAYAGPWESESSFVTADRHRFEGSREAIKEQIARTALRTLLARCD